MKYQFTVLLAFVFIMSHGQNNLIGTWRRIDPYFKQIINDSSQSDLGDLTLFPDSTFFIQGDTSIAFPDRPGWHVGDEYKGIWHQSDKNHLSLRQKNVLVLNFLIVELTKEKLVLKERNDRKNEKRFYWTYRRI